MEDRARTDEEEPVTLGHLSQDISFVTRALRAVILSHNAPFFEAHHVAGGEVAVLSLIGLNPGLTQKKLAKTVILKKSALTKLVNELEKSGLIERRKEGADMRLTALYLTPAGTERLARMRPDMDALQRRLLASLSPGERVMLFELLWRLIGDLDGSSHQRGQPDA
ncbi:MarR family winged helix-turn-helix transcriptional regulator [Citreimonas salinaria]|uniref:DNA-binding transcriptional regulator, MarR family n=1 Tax=Citreimonas salinaria TaxID=321339 RepID=A0A1H3LAL3_9RHOB|nr:MarR family transcriptional regulator [Citreimonas salinaria]SDY60994.1 DNA-binding transcriptional regulator, MarR family [Citreimonas salinaria]